MPRLSFEDNVISSLHIIFLRAVDFRAEFSSFDIYGAFSRHKNVNSIGTEHENLLSRGAKET